MIVLSDGQPACSGNSDDQNTHLVNVVKKIEKAGIDVVGLGISSDAVKQYYSRNIVFHDSAEIASRVIGELSRMLVASS
jgi:cobalamin biosynthesis protein CobT